MNTQEQNREALIRHIADLDAVIRRRNEQIENQAHNARETQRALEEIARERDAYQHDARAAESALSCVRAALGLPDDATTDDMEEAAAHRPLTPDAITDEMVRRAREEFFGGNVGSPVSGPSSARRWRAALTAALTEPPARPKGAEEWEEWLIEAMPHESMPDEDIARLADQIAAHLADPTRKEA